MNMMLRRSLLPLPEAATTLPTTGSLRFAEALPYVELVYEKLWLSLVFTRPVATSLCTSAKVLLYISLFSVCSEKASLVASVERLALALVHSTPVASWGRNFLFFVVDIFIDTQPWYCRLKGKSYSSVIVIFS